MSPRAILLAAAAASLPGCAAIEYYAQAIKGHFDVIARAEPIEQRLAEPGVPVPLKTKLARVLQIRSFASRELGLPDNGSFRRYADLGRPFVVWNVFAAPEFSVRPIESCFPLAGCVGYRGFYAEADALRYAQGLRDQENDVFVGGVPAYSTLGWFDDPVLSTFINYPDAEVARLIFHELAHQVAYVKDDTIFNESFAVAVEQIGVRRWLERQGTAEQRAAWDVFQSRRRGFVALVQQYRRKLELFYAQPGPLEKKRAGKVRLFEQMRKDYEALKASWGGFAGYDRFIAQGLNNAFLASVVTYTELVPTFQALMEKNGGDLVRFYAEVKRIAKLGKPERDAKLLAIRQAGHPGRG